MKAIIIEDKDAKALLAELELEKFKGSPSWSLESSVSPEKMHRRFHYIVVKWFQEQGADFV